MPHNSNAAEEITGKVTLPRQFNSVPGLSADTNPTLTKDAV